MKFIRNSLLRPLQFLLVVCLCITMFWLSAVPAQAGNSAKPTNNSTQLNEIMDEAANVGHSAPMNMEQTAKRANEGLNEVQGAADQDKFKSNDSKPAVVDDFENAMDKATQRKQQRSH
jgi:predicted peptidase